MSLGGIGITLIGIAMMIVSSAVSGRRNSANYRKEPQDIVIDADFTEIEEEPD